MATRKKGVNVGKIMVLQNNLPPTLRVELDELTEGIAKKAAPELLKEATRTPAEQDTAETEETDTLETKSDEEFSICDICSVRNHVEICSQCVEGQKRVDFDRKLRRIITVSGKIRRGKKYFPVDHEFDPQNSGNWSAFFKVLEK